MIKLLLVFCALFSASYATRPYPLNRLHEVVSGEETGLFVQNMAKNFDNLGKQERLTLVNEFVDLMLTELSHAMPAMGLDPLQLPDQHSNFSVKVILITVHGELDLTKGWVTDLSTLHRDGDVKLDYTGRVLTANVPIAFKDILLTYDYNVKLMDIGPDGSVDCTVKDIKFHFIIKLDFDRLHVTLDQFKFDKNFSINVKWHGNILFDWLLNILTNLTTGIFKGLITWIVEIIMKGQLESMIEILNEFLAGINNLGNQAPYFAGFNPDILY